MSETVFPMFPTTGAGAANSSQNRYAQAFPDPFFDYASTQMPRSLYDVLRWCEYLWLTNGTFRMAAQRVVRYFLTKIELQDASDDEKEKYEEFLNKQIKILDVLATIGDDYMCYGNSFTSLHIPFRRYLRCRKCRHERAIGKLDYSFENWEFNATCPQCGWVGVFERVDRRSVEEDKPRIIRWSPHDIRLQHHPISHEVSYYWVPPADLKREVRKGNPFYLASTPWEIVQTLRTDKWFEFNKGVMYHFKEETVAGLRNAGWGIPRILANFKQAWYVQVLKRYNEAIGLDYIIPFRIITPGKGSGSGEVDPLYHVNAGSFMGKVMGLIRRHRQDPTSWNALPFPIDYRALGGEGQDLAPVDLINAGQDEFLNAMGVPAEMYRGTLEIQAAPMALRLFERTWTHFVSALNGWVNWLFEGITDLMNWEKISGRLQPTTLAEDIEKKQVQLQLAAAQQISKQTAFAPFGLDWREEVRRMFEEEKQFQDESKKFQEEQTKTQEFEQLFAQADAAAMQGAGGGGMPGAPAGPTPPSGPVSPTTGAPAAGGTTPADLIGQAEQIAMQMLGMPYEARKSELLKLKKSDETLHALVIQKMDSIRNQAKNEGGFQALQQMTGSQTG